MKNSLLYSIPSPHQVSLLIKEDCPFFDESFFRKQIDINLQSTSEKKALILGALGADLGYLSLYEQKDLTLQYLGKIRRLLDDSKVGPNDVALLFERIENNLENSDSILIILSEVYRKENEAIRTGEQPHLGPLVMAGGWIESFYLLNKLYDKTRNSNLFGIVLQQQYVLENLIAILKPYYKKSPDYTELIDQLVNISYEFEVIDMNYKNSPAINKENTTYVKCKFTPLLTGSHLEEIGEMSGSLRNIIIF